MQFKSHIAIARQGALLVAFFYASDAFFDDIIYIFIIMLLLARRLDLLDDFGRDFIILLDEGVPLCRALEIAVAERAQRGKLITIVRFAQISDASGSQIACRALREMRTGVFI